MRFRVFLVALLSFASAASITAAVAFAAAGEICVGGCLYGYDCPTELPPGPHSYSCRVPAPEPNEPKVEEQAAEDITSTTAVLRAKVDPGGEHVARILWEYGFGSQWFQPVGDLEAGPHGEGPVVSTVTLTGLQPHMYYSFRPIIENGAGLFFYGPSETFYTADAPPEEPGTVTPPAPTEEAATPPTPQEEPAPVAPSAPPQQQAEGDASMPAQSSSPTPVILAPSLLTPSTPASGAAARPSASSSGSSKKQAVPLSKKLTRELKACRVLAGRRRQRCVRRVETREHALRHAGKA